MSSQLENGNTTSVLNLTDKDDTQCQQYVLTAAEVRLLEKKIEAEGASLFALMKRAGGSVSRFVMERFKAPCSVAIFCGSGNNGGDGWVIANNLAAQGYIVSLITPCDAHLLVAEPARTAALEVAAKEYPKLSPDSSQKEQDALSILINPTAEQISSVLCNSQVVIDALLGIGFCGTALKEPYGSWVEEINLARQKRQTLQHHKEETEELEQSDASAQQKEVALSVIAVDIPSGLSADTGKAANPCIIADATITMLACKPGLLLESSSLYCGELFLAQLDSE